MRGLVDKVAVVTGGGSSKGIGLASARRLAEEGVKVLLTDIQPGAAAKQAAQLADAGLEVVGIDQDVTDENQWGTVLAQAVDRWGRLDILVNNAGVSLLEPFADLPLENFKRSIDINLNSVFLGCRAALSEMDRQGNGGAIVNISSLAAFLGAPGIAGYAASKAGVNMLTKVVAIEAIGRGVRVNSIHPGGTATAMMERAIENNPDTIEGTNSTIPIGRFADPSEIAAMVAFLASDDASYCVGASFVVDGGMLAV